MHYGRERDHAHPNPKRARAQAAEEALEQMDHERLAAESLAASHRAAAGERGVAGLEGPHTVDTKVLEDRLRFLAADEGAGLTKTAVAASHELAECAVLGSLSHIDAQTNQPTMVDVQVPACVHPSGRMCVCVCMYAYFATTPVTSSRGSSPNSEG